MARPLRIELKDGCYHVTARGNERRAIFRADSDRKRFLEILGEAAGSFGLVVHAYVLMPNHYHLMLGTPEGGLSRAMQWINVSYSAWFNRRHARSGHLFQGRFGAVVVDFEQWGAELSRYVHLNPVRTARFGLSKRGREEQRTGVCVAPEEGLIDARIAALREYRWGSFRAYAGLERGAPWLRTEEVYRLLGGAWRARRSSYRSFVEEAVREGRRESPWDQMQAGLLLGSKEFAEKVRKAVGGNAREQPSLRALKREVTLEQIIAAVERVKGERWQAFRDRHGDWGRDTVLLLARKKRGERLRALGAAVGGLDYSSISIAVSRFARRVAQEPKLQKLIAKVEHQMSNAKM